MKKIAIITTYHGIFPNYIDFWFKSIASNPTIDFFLFTDIEIVNSPSNLIIIKKSFREIVEMAQQHFHFQIEIKRPQKYPDLRPAFGTIFSEYIQGYDYWGFSEQDLIYGDIRSFFPDELLEKYDKLLGNGHFTLYRNIPEVNSKYKQIDHPEYKYVYTHGRNFFFEEFHGTSGWWLRNLPERTYQEFIFDDINYFKRHFVPNYNVAPKEKNIIYSFEKGKVFRWSEYSGKVKKTECLYVHFQKRPMSVRTVVGDKWTMIPDAFIPFVENVNIHILRKYGHKRFSYGFRYWNLQWKRVVVKFWKIVNPTHLD